MISDRPEGNLHDLHRECAGIFLNTLTLKTEENSYRFRYISMGR